MQRALATNLTKCMNTNQIFFFCILNLVWITSKISMKYVILNVVAQGKFLFTYGPDHLLPLSTYNNESYRKKSKVKHLVENHSGLIATQIETFKFFPCNFHYRIIIGADDQAL